MYLLHRLDTELVNIAIHWYRSRLHSLQLGLLASPKSFECCRALFGDQEECLTTLLAWQSMTHEAKWFGRALYDAEEMAIRACGQHMTDS